MYNKYIKDNMLEGSSVRAIIRFAVPLLIGNVFQQIYSFVDTVLVGKYIGTDALAAVGASGNAVALIILLLMGFTTGASILISQEYGAGNKEGICRTASALYKIILCSTIVLGAAGVIASRGILVLLHTPRNILSDATLYLKTVFLGVPFVALYNAGASVARSMGRSVMPLVVLVISSLINVVLDIVFITVLDMGVQGAAYATVLSQVISALICSVFIYIKRREYSLDGFDLLHVKTEDIKRIVRIGIPMSFQSSVIVIGSMCIQGLINSFGTVVVAAYTAASKIDLIAIQVVVSVGTAMSVFAGQNMGAGNVDRIKDAVKKILLIQICLCTFIAVVLVLKREDLLRLFLDDASGEALLIGSRYITIVGIAYISAGIMQTYLNVLKGAGDIDFSIYVGIAEVSIRIVMAYILSKTMRSETGIWIATPVAWVIACVYTVFRYRTGKWICIRSYEQKKQ